MPYPLTAPAFETKMTSLAATHHTVCKKTAFPNQTVSEGMGPTTYSFLEIGRGVDPNRVTALAIAGMHAREWAQPDAVLSFAENLLSAYKSNNAFVIPAYTEGGKTFGPVSVQAPTIKAIINKLDILLVPLANPDGRAFSQSAKTDEKMLWRKNRAPRPPGGPPQSVGVDLNRNFDIAWDFDVYYNRAFLDTHTLSASKDPADFAFIGKPKPAPDQHHPRNEPEVKNLIWLLDNRPVTFNVDLHSALLKIMHPWGIERNGSNSAQTFQKTVFDGQRDGTLGDAYSEFFPNTPPARVLDKHDQIVKSMQGKIKAATGRTYRFGGIADTVYPATGSFTDFAFSRQFIIASSPPQYAFAAEFGTPGPDGFQPHPTNSNGYPKIEREIHALLLAFFEAALAAVPPPVPVSPPPPAGTGTGSGTGSGGGLCSLALVALELGVGSTSIDTLRCGRERLLVGRYTRAAMLALDRAYRRLSARSIPFLERRRWARLAVAYGILVPTAMLTDLALKWDLR
ncbi:M14 family zinc carboxypeptidase [Nocardia fluminea]|uniref:M14 family zinc carboxypeptidase n=1 Tax=Nocardia fluminea TaxID=134984 RepID=UPI00365ADBBF